MGCTEEFSDFKYCRWISLWNFFPARSAPANCKCYYYTMEASRSHNSSVSKRSTLSGASQMSFWLNGKPSQESGGSYSHSERDNSVLMSMVLEWNVQQGHISVMVKCPHTFGNVLYFCSQPWQEVRKKGCLARHLNPQWLTVARIPHFIDI